MFRNVLLTALMWTFSPLSAGADATLLQPIRSGNIWVLQIPQEELAILDATPDMRIKTLGGSALRLETLRFEWLDGVLEPVLSATLIDEEMAERTEADFAAIHLTVCKTLAPSALAAFARYYPTADVFVFGIVSAAVAEVPGQPRNVFRSGFTLLDGTCTLLDTRTLENSFSVNSARDITLSAPDIPDIVLEAVRASESGAITYTYQVPELEEAQQQDLARRLCLYNYYRSAHDPNAASMRIALKQTRVSLLIFRTSTTQHFLFSEPATDCKPQD